MSEMKAFHMDKGFYGAAQLVLPASTLQGLDCTFRWVVFLKKPRTVNHPISFSFLGDSFPEHCKEDPIYLFPEMKIRGLIPNFHIHVSVNDLFIPRIGPPIFLQQNRQIPIRGICKSITDIWILELGTRPSSFISENICFKFSVQCLCSAANFPLF